MADAQALYAIFQFHKDRAVEDKDLLLGGLYVALQSKAWDRVGTSLHNLVKVEGGYEKRPSERAFLNATMRGLKEIGIADPMDTEGVDSIEVINKALSLSASTDPFDEFRYLTCWLQLHANNHFAHLNKVESSEALNRFVETARWPKLENLDLVLKHLVEVEKVSIEIPEDPEDLRVRPSFFDKQPARKWVRDSDPSP